MKSVSLAIVVLVAVLGVSCQKSKTSTGAIRHHAARGNNGVGGATLPAPFDQQTGQSQMVYSQSSGRIFTEARYSTEFNHAIGGLVSPTLSPEDLGYISPLDGVRFKGYIELDSRGQVLPTNSLIQIEIYDEFVGQSEGGITIQPFIFSVPAKSGSASNGQFQLRFEDGYGYIQLDGQFTNGGKASGFLSFDNKNGRSGEGLSFEIETCGFFRCQK